MQLPKDEWFKAADDGDDELLKKLLAQHPNLITQVDDTLGQTALHFASNGSLAAVTLLLAAHPTLIDIKNREGMTPLHCAASRGYLNPQVPYYFHLFKYKQVGHDEVAALLLATSPGLVTQVDAYGWTALRYAAWANTAKVFDRLLVACPEVITAHDSMAILSYAIDRGHGDLVAKILTTRPELITNARNYRGETILHYVIQMGQDDLATQILAARPESIVAVDSAGCNALHYAARFRQGIVEKLLAIKPEAVFAVSNSGNTVLHDAIVPCRDTQLVAKLWRMNPQALHAVNQRSKTPFGLAVTHRKRELIELFRESVPFEELMLANTNAPINASAWRKHRPLMERNCAPLFEALNKDVVSLILEYFGFPQIKHRPRRKRAQNGPQQGLLRTSLRMKRRKEREENREENRQ